MLDEYERYQGVVLRQLIVGSNLPLAVLAFRPRTRASAFLINGVVGVFVKHSSRRLSPWTFTFHRDQVADLAELEVKCPTSFVAFVCGSDGSLAISSIQLRELIDFEQPTQSWIRIERKRRSQYGVSGTRGVLTHKIAQGVGPILTALRTDGMQEGQNVQTEDHNR